MPHLFVSISAHGFGHITQSACVVNALRQLHPELRLTIQCGVARELLAQWITGEFEHQQRATDIGMLMDNAVDVQREQSLTAYQAIHRDWPKAVAEEAERISPVGPDLVLSNISYLTLAAARRAGIRSAALCSLNWADITAGYFSGQEFRTIRAQMLEGYRAAEVFLCPEPSMPMPELPNTRTIGPLARLGVRRRQELDQHLGLAPEDRLVLVGLGGIPTELDMTRWPRAENIRWLVPDNWPLTHPNAIPFGATGLPFIDLLTSSDTLLTKPGYGSFAEAACNGIPVLYLRRQDWPEERWLVQWLQDHTRCEEIGRTALAHGELLGPLSRLWNSATGARPPLASGETPAAQLLADLLAQPWREH